MTINMAAYNELRNRFLSRCTSCTDQNLQRLKVHFKDTINSTRRGYDIRSIGDLIRVLEKRNALNGQNLDCLKDVAQLLNRQDLEDLIDYGLERHVISRPPPVVPIQHRQQHVQAAPAVLNPPHPVYHERIYQLIIDQIGNRWKDLARNLGIAEGKIDELTLRYHFEPSERVREILRYHESNSPTHEVWTRLMDALVSSRRTDLKNEVQRILVGN